MIDETFAECERLIQGLNSYCDDANIDLTALVRDLVWSTILYILDGEASLDDLEACEKALFGVKFEKRFIKALGLPRKISKKKNPHGLKLDTRIAGINLDIKTTLGGKTWMIPGEAVGEWLFVVAVDLKAQTFSCGFLKATPENLCAGKNQDKKGSVSAEGRCRVRWLAQSAPYAPEVLPLGCDAFGVAA